MRLFQAFPLRWSRASQATMAAKVRASRSMTPSAQSLVNHLESVKDAVLAGEGEDQHNDRSEHDPGQRSGEPSGDVGPAQRTGQDTFAAK
ncbi:hypothetical protein ACQPZ8_11810 [Actinomadura nitritigenes]|uniref:hypothetical protein n=1 Tax=Actinomadura nitritigenes TaxID=134602 RepID=UPI003D8AAD1E